MAKAFAVTTSRLDQQVIFVASRGSECQYLIPKYLGKQINGSAWKEGRKSEFKTYIHQIKTRPDFPIG